MRTDFFLEAMNEIDDKYIEEVRSKTMKKKFNFKSMIAVAACALFALAAVPVANYFANTPGNTPSDAPIVQPTEDMFTVYESGIHDSITIGTHKIELKLNSGRSDRYREEKRGTEKTITLNGLEWTGEYKTSITATDYNVSADKYESISNGKRATFILNSETGKCEYLFVSNDKTDDTVLERDELYTIAYETFMNGGFTDDPENYALSDELDQKAGGYWFKFSRFINGIETCDYVVLCFKKDGQFSWLIGNRIGEMKDVDVSELDMDKFYSAVETKLKKIYGDAYVGFDKEGAVFTKLTDGSYVFDYGVDVNVTNDKGEGVLDRCYLTVAIGK